MSTKLQFLFGFWLLLASKINCLIPYEECYMEGAFSNYEYAGQYLDTFNECLEQCKLRSLCEVSTWDPERKICHLHKYVSEINYEACPKCTSSAKDCRKISNRRYQGIKLPKSKIETAKSCTESRLILKLPTAVAQPIIGGVAPAKPPITMF